MFYFKKRLSVAAAMTVLTLIVAAFVVVWATDPDATWWNQFNHIVLVVMFGAGAFGAWEATRRGSKPAQFAPTVAAVWVFLFMVGVLLSLVGVRAAEPAAIPPTISIPYPTDVVLLLVSLVFAVYSTAVGFWLVTRE